MTKTPCKYCGRPIAPQGMPAHLHFKHLSMIQIEFLLNPIIQAFRWIEDGYRPSFGDRKQLTAPNPLTVYSDRPLGYMAAPIPQHRVPKGYKLPYGHGRPFERVR